MAGSIMRRPRQVEVPRDHDDERKLTPRYLSAQIEVDPACDTPFGVVAGIALVAIVVVW